mmetsp:Transcript_14321/g.23173  ORF Transcript_14321/g.23173 Transcript_14321/m.23173 type:complete len:110 (-) Transcript_14321:791-1120(-)
MLIFPVPNRSGATSFRCNSSFSVSIHDGRASSSFEFAMLIMKNLYINEHINPNSHNNFVTVIKYSYVYSLKVYLVTQDNQPQEFRLLIVRGARMNDTAFARLSFFHHNT